MKKLTWLFLSLMLFLGMGTAFADDPATLPTPTFTPNSGTVAPGDEIVFDVPSAYESQAYTVLVLYTFDATATFGEFTYDYIDGFMEELGAPASLTGINAAMRSAGMGGWSAKAGSGWAPAVQIPSDAQGSVTMRAHMVVINPDESVSASEMVTANYTVEGSVEPEQPTVLDITPVFNPASGSAVTAGSKVKVSIDDEYDLSEYWMYYVIDNENFDFSQYTNEDDIKEAGAKDCTGISITISKACKVTVAVCKIGYDQYYTETFTAWSTPVTATYTIAEPEPEPEPANDIPMPEFNPNGGTVPAGTKVILTNGTESDATPLPIYYNTKNDATAFTGVTNQTQLENALKPGMFQKLWLYPAEGIDAPDGKPINAATASIDADGKVTWSTVVTKYFTIGEDPTPGDDTPVAPVFNPDGGEIEAEAEISLTSTCASCPIYYNTNANFVNTIKTEEQLDDEANDMTSMFSKYDATAKPSLADLNVSTPGAKLSLSAASASIDGEGNVTWSEVTTREFTVKAEDEPVVDVAIPTITPANDAYVHMGDMVTIECATEGAEIYYTTNGTKPFTMDKDGYPVSVREGDDVFKYTEPFALTEDMLIQQRAVWALKITAVAAKGNSISANGASAGLNVLPNAPEFSVEAGEVLAGTKVSLSCVPSQAVIYYTLDGTTPTMEEGTLYEGAITITEDVTLKARAVLGQYQSGVVTAAYTVTETEVELTFDPASGSEVEENTAVTITSTVANVEIFYMMFESEAAAKAAEWNQEEALSYSDELKPVISAEKNTVKAAYALPGAEALSEGFFYATYKVGELPAIDLTFNPAPGSEVEEGTKVTVTASRETEIFYSLYADKAAADADEAFMANAKEVTEDGMPVITKGNTFLRCGVFDKGTMQYFDAAYTVKPGETEANEDLELAGVSVYPNPSNGVVNIDLPVAATVEVFAINGVLMQHLNANAGNVTLNINRSGIYFLRITGEGRTAIKRIIVR